jgi:hypothetical protein
MPDDLLTLRFEGEPLIERSLPIYGLGRSFIAVQRLLHKAALFEQGRLEKGAHLPMVERESIALQISAHRKGSDTWVFAAYLSNPEYGPILQTLISTALIALGAYARKKVFPGKRPPANQVLVVNIFPEVRSLTDRVDSIGGVKQIELTQGESEEPLVINSDTKKYVREIENTLIPGRPCEITGRVTRLHPQSFRFDLEDAPKHYVHVRIAEPLFEKIRRLPRLQGRTIRIKGVPLYRLGNTFDMEEFRAEKVILLRQRKK